MSGILIKDMEMPRPGQIVLVEIDENGDVFAAYDGGRTKLSQYKAVPVPPHGDLIDRDKLLNGEGLYLISFQKAAVDTREILRAPTIIPAEPSEEQREYEAAVEAAQHCERYEPTYDPETGAM